MEKILEKSGNFVSPEKWEPWWGRLRDVSFWLQLCCGKIKVNIDTLLAADVLSEDTILRWYNEAHLSKGKSVFLEQMKQFVEWLKNAEEG